MAVSRSFAIALLAVAVPSVAAPGLSNCWIKELSVTNGKLLVIFEASTPLAISGTAPLLQTSASAAFSATYELGEGQVLQVKLSPETTERCELEPVLSPAFKGVTRNVWSRRADALDPVVMSAIVKAQPR